MVDRPFLDSQKWQEQQWRAVRYPFGGRHVRRGAHSDIVQFEKAFVRECAKMGIPMFAHNMVRTDAEQTALYVQGVSQSPAGKSPHNFGCAVDLIHSVQAWDLSKREWLLLGHIGKEVAVRRGLKLRWGGDWNRNGVPVPDDPDEKFWDPAHWELHPWRECRVGFPFAEPL